VCVVFADRLGDLGEVADPIARDDAPGVGPVDLKLAMGAELEGRPPVDLGQ